MKTSIPYFFRQRMILKQKKRGKILSFCDSRGIQTHNLLIRSQMLYSVELGSLNHASFSFCGCKGMILF